jgi:hypothetical protein
MKNILSTKIQRKFCKHDYEEKDEKRTCRKCGNHEWMFVVSYPSVGQPKYSWRTMNIDHYNFNKENRWKRMLNNLF